MMPIIEDTVTLTVWLGDAGIKAVAAGREPVYHAEFNSPDMTTVGWIKVKELGLSFRRPTPEQVLPAAIASIEAKEAELKEKFAAAMMELSDQRQSLLALPLS